MLKHITLIACLLFLCQISFAQSEEEQGLRTFLFGQHNKEDSVKKNRQARGKSAYRLKIDKIITIREASLDSIGDWFVIERDKIRAEGNDVEIEDKKIVELRGKRDNYEEEIKAVFRTAAGDIYEDYKEDKHVRPFPSFTGYTTALHYNSDNRFGFFENTNINFGSDNGSFESEVATGYPGVFKITLSTVLAREKTEQVDPLLLKGLSDTQVDSLVSDVQKKNEKNNTFLKVISNGGEANLSIKTPVLDIGKRRSPIAFRSDAAAKLSADIPVAGTYIDGNQTNMFYSFSLENRLLIPINNFDAQKKSFTSFAIFGTADLRYIGGTKSFQNSIDYKGGFGYLEYSGGIAIRNILIYYTRQAFFDPVLDDQKRGRFGAALIKQL